jgi:hypothetical protein
MVMVMVMVPPVLMHSAAMMAVPASVRLQTGGLPPERMRTAVDTVVAPRVRVPVASTSVP